MRIGAPYSARTTPVHPEGGIPRLRKSRGCRGNSIFSRFSSFRVGDPFGGAELGLTSQAASLHVDETSHRDDRHSKKGTD
jgi:hypothetical protein